MIRKASFDSEPVTNTRPRASSVLPRPSPLLSTTWVITPAGVLRNTSFDCRPTTQIVPPAATATSYGSSRWSGWLLVVSVTLVFVVDVLVFVTDVDEDVLAVVLVVDVDPGAVLVDDGSAAQPEGVLGKTAMSMRCHDVMGVRGSAVPRKNATESVDTEVGSTRSSVSCAVAAPPRCC